MHIRDTLSSDSEHVKGRACTPQWRDVAVRRRRAEEEEEEERRDELGQRPQQKQHQYSSYELPDHSLRSYVTFVPCAILHSLRNMAAVFGWQFLFSIFVVYGVQQGMANSWFFQARDYYFKDVAKVRP